VYIIMSGFVFDDMDPAEKSIRSHEYVTTIRKVLCTRNILCLKGWEHNILQDHCQYP